MATGLRGQQLFCGSGACSLPGFKVFVGTRGRDPTRTIEVVLAVAALVVLIAPYHPTAQERPQISNRRD